MRLRRETGDFSIKLVGTMDDYSGMTQYSLERNKLPIGLGVEDFVGTVVLYTRGGKPYRITTIISATFSGDGITLDLYNDPDKRTLYYYPETGELQLMSYSGGDDDGGGGAR